MVWVLLQIIPSLAKVLLHTHEWNISSIINEYRSDASRLLISSKIKAPTQPEPLSSHGARVTCPVCIMPYLPDKFRSLACGHLFCTQCWFMHFEVQISQGHSTSESFKLSKLFSTHSRVKSYSSGSD